jgi:hypothetical protein
MNLERFGRKRTWFNRDIHYPGITWRDWGKSEEASARMASIAVEIRTEHLLNTSPDRNRYTNLLGYDVLMAQTFALISSENAVPVLFWHCKKFLTVCTTLVNSGLLLTLSLFNLCNVLKAVTDWPGKWMN